MRFFDENVCLSPFVPQFQIWPSKSRHFCLQSIGSERKRKEHTIIDKVECGLTTAGKSPVSYRKQRFCTRRVRIQVKV